MILDYDNLTPDRVIDAVESQGFISDLRISPLNSYENRVYQIGIEDNEPLIAKFYRPRRWTDEQILEEHVFSWQLANRDLPIIAPLANSQNSTLFHFENYRFALFPRRGGQSPEPGDLEQLYRLGQLIGRIHSVGQISAFHHRPTLTLQTYGYEPAALILTDRFVPSYLQEELHTLTEKLLQLIQEAFDSIHGLRFLRTHGDCHIGNILWHRDLGPAFVDMDDCINAPAIQDLWMMLSGNLNDRSLQISEILEGYSQFMTFNSAELKLVEPLRTLRMIHYAGWLAKRWDDPAFPLHFPWFNTDNYWRQHLTSLQEQWQMMQEPPLQCF